MKRFFVMLLCAVLLLSLATVGTSAISSNVDASAWSSVELKALYVQSAYDLMSDLNEDYSEYWWEDEIPDLDDNWCNAANVNMRGFAMSPDGHYLYMGHLNGGSGVRGVAVFDTETCVLTDYYYHYDGEIGLVGSPFSYPKGIAADDRGYVYVGYAFSKNYNVVNLGIAQQQEDGTLTEVSFEPVFAFGDPGDEGGIKVGVNGVDVAKVGDKYYCYAMLNYDYDALYCIDVTDPQNPKLNKDFGTDGVIIFSEPSNTVAGDGFTLKEGQYLDVDDDGTIWVVVNSNEGTDGIMKIAPDGSACADVAVVSGVYSVEHEGGFLLCGMKDGSAVVVLDDASYETIATIPLTADYGDRVVRMQVVNDVLFVADAGNDTVDYNAVHAAPLSAEGQEFFNQLVANLNNHGEEETTEEVTEGTHTGDETTVTTTETPTEEESTVEAPDENTTTVASAEDVTTEEPGEAGCASTVGFAAVAVLMAVAACVVRKKERI